MLHLWNRFITEDITHTTKWLIFHWSLLYGTIPLWVNTIGIKAELWHWLTTKNWKGESKDITAINVEASKYTSSCHNNDRYMAKANWVKEDTLLSSLIHIPPQKDIKGERVQWREYSDSQMCYFCKRRCTTRNQLSDILHQKH